MSIWNCIKHGTRRERCCERSREAQWSIDRDAASVPTKTSDRLVLKNSLNILRAATRELAQSTIANPRVKDAASTRTNALQSLGTLDESIGEHLAVVQP